MDLLISAVKKLLFISLAPFYVAMVIFLNLTHDWWTGLWD